MAVTCKVSPGMLLQSRKYGFAIGCFSDENVDRFSESSDFCDFILDFREIIPRLAYHEERRNRGSPNDTGSGPDKCR